MIARLAAAGALALLAPALPLQAQSTSGAKRPLRVEDIHRVREVRNPQRSPDGKWIAYTVTSVDSAKDKSDTDVWMSSWDGTQHLRMTSTAEGESSPRFSPDGRYLSFVSGRMGAEGGQLWLMNRMGGEAEKLTSFKGGVEDYAWSPDGRRLAFVIEDESDTAKAKSDTAKPKTPKPIVVDRYTFKRDVVGYLGGKRQRIYLYDIASKKSELLTSGPAFDEAQVAWSPDGRRIAFVSKRGQADPDRDNNTDIWVAEARGASQIRRVTSFAGQDDSPVWSPDGRSIAYLQGSDPKFGAYNMDRLAVVQVDGCPANGCTPRILTQELDRGVSSLRWAPDGSAIHFVVTDDRTSWIGRVRPTGGRVEPLTTGRRTIGQIAEVGSDGRIAVTTSTAATIPEIHAFESGQLRKVTGHNDDFLAGIQLGTTEDFTSRSKDGTEVHSLLVTPAGYKSGTRLPMILWIHGGPNSQDQHSFSFERELYAANGYAVLSVNYRGSAGRGEKYGTAIYGDWGNLEVVDLVGAVDAAIAAGVADPNRLGIGGWSYGGILTDYTIATTDRFKGAISGAGSAMQIAMYGIDQYTVQYETEIGLPWKNPDQWIRISYPFFHADRIRTPTLFLVGERDFNVPAAGSEQMYQALRSLGVPTQLVIYPGQFHGISVPSYRVDRLQRYLAWYDRYVKKGATGDVRTAGSTQ